MCMLLFENILPGSLKSFIGCQFFFVDTCHLNALHAHKPLHATKSIVFLYYSKCNIFQSWFEREVSKFNFKLLTDKLVEQSINSTFRFVR